MSPVFQRFRSQPGGFPADSCGNKLVVDAYKKDVVLRLYFPVYQRRAS